MLALLVGLSAIPITYACHDGGWDWWDWNKTYCCPTPDCDAHFTWTATNDDGNDDNGGGYSPIDPDDDGLYTEYDYGWGSTSSDDPDGYPVWNLPVPGDPIDREVKDVGRAEAWIDSCKANKITMVIDNAYPYYAPTTFFTFACGGSIASTIEAITLDEDASTPGVADDIPELEVSYSGIAVGDTLAPGEEALGMLHVMVNQCAEQMATYTISLVIDISCEKFEQKCDTAFGYYDGCCECVNGDNHGGCGDCGDCGDCDDRDGCGDCGDCGDCDDNGYTGFSGGYEINCGDHDNDDGCGDGGDCNNGGDCCDCAKCFLDYGFHRWGWTNGPLSEGSYTFDLYAGAAQCKLYKGYLAGWIDVDYSGGTVTVTYNTYTGYVLTETHLYAGNDKFPKKNGSPTVAPGQYPYKHDPLDNVTTDSYTVTGLSGDIYIIAHAVVCSEYTPSVTPTPTCSPKPTPTCSPKPTPTCSPKPTPTCSPTPTCTPTPPTGGCEPTPTPGGYDPGPYPWWWWLFPWWR
jgi:hypothetical protein